MFFLLQYLTVYTDRGVIFTIFMCFMEKKNWPKCVIRFSDEYEYERSASVRDGRASPRKNRLNDHGWPSRQISILQEHVLSREWKSMLIIQLSPFTGTFSRYETYNDSNPENRCWRKARDLTREQFNVRSWWENDWFTENSDDRTLVTNLTFKQPGSELQRNTRLRRTVSEQSMVGVAT